jgi:leucyl aminopeptidase
VAVEVAERENLVATVMDLDDIVEAGLGGLIGVNKGSHHPPRLVVLAYEPPSPKGTLALVGKGITFDSGGLSMKPPDGMMTMKDDMAGAAAVLGAFSAMAAVGVKSRVIGFMPLTDNMVSGDATRPGDVLRIRNGTTVEVLNTDAEGRLILADALCLAVEEGPDAIVDLATLTGAVDIALGPAYAGMLGNHDGWLDQVRSASVRAGEGLWPLPLPDDYRRHLESEIADLRNISKVRSAGTLTAGLFLSNFVGDVPWAHLDIAAAAWSGETRGADAAGGTGFGVRTLLELARTFKRPR